MTCIYHTNESLFPFGREPPSSCKQHSVSEIMREKSMWDVKKEDLFLNYFHSKQAFDQAFDQGKTLHFSVY